MWGVTDVTLVCRNTSTAFALSSFVFYCDSVQIRVTDVGMRTEERLEVQWQLPSLASLPSPSRSDS